MANTITIDLDDTQAITSLDNLIDDLGDAQTETEALAERGQEVVESQTKQIVIIQKNATEWKTFATVATESIGEVATASIDLAGDILHIEHAFQSFALDAGKKAIDTLFNIAEMTVKYTLIAKGASTVIGAVRGNHKQAAAAADENTAALKKESDGFVETAAKATLFGLVLNTLTGNWQSSEQAATSAGSAYLKWRLGLGQASLIAVGVIATIKAGDAFSEKMKQIAKDTEGATDDFGRLSNAAAGAAHNLTRPFSEVGPALSGIWGGIKEDFSNWTKQIGKDAYEYFGVKKAVDYGEKNLRDWGTFFENWIDEARGNFVRFENSATKALGFKGDDNADRYVEEAKALRELADWHEKMDAQREKEKAGFEAVRKVNEDWIKGIEERKHAEEIASIQSLSDIQARIQAAQQLAGKEAQTGKQVKENAERLAKDLDLLEQRRTQIVEEETAKRLAKEKEAAEATKREAQAVQSVLAERISQGRQTAIDAARASGTTEREIHQQRLRWIEEERQAAVSAAKSQTDIVVANAEAEKKAIQEIEGFRREEIKRSQEARVKAEELQKAQASANQEIERASAEFADSMELNSLKLKLDAGRNLAATTKEQKEAEFQRQLAVDEQLHQKRLEIIARETKREFDAAKTKEDKLRAVTEGQKRWIAENAEFEKSKAQEIHDHKQKLAEEEQRKKDDLQRAKVDALKPVAEQIIATQTPQQRIQELQRLRGQQARDKAIADAGFQNEDSASPQARRAAAKAEQEARRQAVLDARQGNVGADEQAQVANNLANKTIGQMQRQGKLSADVVGTQQQAVQVMAQQQANTDALTQQVKQVQNSLDALKNASDPGRWRAGMGGQRG